MTIWLLGLWSVFVTLIILIIYARRRWARYRMQARFQHGRDAEQPAAQLLRKSGYLVLKHRFRRAATMYVDGKLRSFDVEADYIVGKGGKLFVAEVKTGQASDPVSAATRRQMREYGQVFMVDGLLLVAPDEGTIQEVAFAEVGEIEVDPIRD